jgi:very-short-patch-repair endonuclease
VYRLNGVPDDRWQPLMAAVLAVGSCCAASHRSAAELYVCPGVAAPPLPEITVYGGNTLRLTGVTRHRSDFLEPIDLRVVEHIPVTSPARSLVDLGRYLSPGMLAKTMRYLLRSRLATLDELEECLQRIGGRGRPGTVWLRILFAERRLGAPMGDNEFEAKVGRALREHGVPPGVEQFQVVVGRRVYVLDRAWPEQKVGLEIDGDIHLLEEVADHDVDRGNALEAAGWRIFHARHATNLATLARQVLGALRTRKPSP